MVRERIKEYEIEIEAFQTLSGELWTSYLSIYLGIAEAYRSKCVFPRQRIAIGKTFHNKEMALDEARRIAEMKILRRKF